MFYVAAVTPDNHVVKSEGEDPQLALEKFRSEWNDHFIEKRPVGMNRIVRLTPMFTADQFYHAFKNTKTEWILTTQVAALERFTEAVNGGKKKAKR